MQGKPLTFFFFLFSMSIYLAALPFIQYPLTTVLKPIPIILLMVFSLQTSTNFEIKCLLLMALGFSLAGDIVLTLPINTAVPIGILAFMVTHCIYISLFAKQMKFQINNVLYFLPIMAFILINYYILWPYLGEMKIPVTIYMCVLSFMVFCSFQVTKQRVLIRMGATLFLLSDFLLALVMFVLPSNNPTSQLIMLLYYTAQLLLILGITESRLFKRSRSIVGTIFL